MRLGEKTNVIAEDTLRIPKPGKNGRNDVILVVRALPMGLDEQLEKELPPVNVAQNCRFLGYARDPDSKKLEKENGLPVREYDMQSPKYLQLVKRQNTLRLVAMFYHSVKDANSAESLTFDTDRGTFENADDFYIALLKEMTGFGFSTGDIVIAVNKINEISNLTRESIEEAKEDFLPDMEDVAAA